MTLNRGIYSIKPEEYQTYMQSSQKEKTLENLDAIIRMLICILLLLVLFFLYKGVEKSTGSIISLKSVASISHQIKTEEKTVISNQSLDTFAQKKAPSILPIQEQTKDIHEDSIKKVISIETIKIETEKVQDIEIISNKSQINSETTISEDYLRLITEELNR